MTKTFEQSRVNPAGSVLLIDAPSALFVDDTRDDNGYAQLSSLSPQSL